MPRPIKYTEKDKEKHIIGFRRSDLPILCSRCSISVHCYDTCLVSGLKWWDIDLAADGTGFFLWSRFSHLSRLLSHFLRPRWEVMDPRLIHGDKSIQKIRYIVLKLHQHSIETYSKYSLCFIVSLHDSILRRCLIKETKRDMALVVDDELPFSSLVTFSPFQSTVMTLALSEISSGVPLLFVADEAAFLFFRQDNPL